MKWVSAIFDTNIEQGKRKEGDVGISMVHIIDNGDGSLSRGIAFLRIDKVGNLEIEGEIGFVALLWINSILCRVTSASVGLLELEELQTYECSAVVGFGRARRMRRSDLSHIVQKRPP